MAKKRKTNDETPTATLFRDRIVGLKRVKASDLLAHEANPKTHPQEQLDALRDILSRLGFIGAMIAREVNGHLELIDGHARKLLVETEPNQLVPVLVVDLNDDETLEALTVYDAVSAMAARDDEKMAALLERLRDVAEPGLAALLASLRTLPEAEAINSARDEWKGMPNYEHEPRPVKSLLVHFVTLDDVAAFARVVEQEVLDTTKSIWFPKRQRHATSGEGFANVENEPEVPDLHSQQGTSGNTIDGASATENASTVSHSG